MTNGGDDHSERGCHEALARAFGFLGKRWNGILLATLLSGPAGFAELKRATAGISDSVLSERLSELASARLVQRTVDEGPPVTVTYALTPAGNALLPALRELTEWAVENYPAAEAACDTDEAAAPMRRPPRARRKAATEQV